MAYVPVNFDLNDFQLSLNTQQSAKFHKRLKELGFDSHQQGDTLTYGRGKSRITAFVVNGSALNFLPDFYDDTPGGTVYAIMEKMCIAFGGTMVGRYSIDGVQGHWDVRISQGMNLSGKADVGKRDHVVDENAAGHLAPSSSSVSANGGANQQTGGQTAQASQPSAPPSSQSGGQVEEGQSGESTRDKLYRVFVEEAYNKYRAEHGSNPEHYFELVRNFNTQFPKEEEKQTWTEEQKKVIDRFISYTGLNNPSYPALYKEIKLLEDNEEAVLYNVSDDLGMDLDEVVAIYEKLGEL